MKKALSLLLAFMFLQVQMWALSGGPVLTPQTSDLTGVYSGVMVAQSVTGAQPSILSQTSSLGVWSLSVPIAGPTTGTTVIFQNNIVYTGTITAAADNRRRTIAGIINTTSTALFVVSPAAAAFTVTVAGSTVVTQVPAVAAVTTPLFAWGTMQVTVSEPGNTNTGNQGANGITRSTASLGGVDANGNPRSLGKTGDNVKGTASIDALFSNVGVIGFVGPAPTITNSTKYSVSGVRETNAFATAVAAP